MQENKDIDFNLLKYKEALSKGFTTPALYFELANENAQDIPFLKSINTSFRIPENYFETLPQTVANKINPISIHKESFDVPENYFNELTVKIQSKIFKKEESVFEKIQQFIFTPKYSLALAGIITIIIASALLFKTENNSIEAYNPKTLAQLSEQSIGNYLSEEDILDELTAGNTENTSNTEIEQMVLDNVDESTLTETL